MTKYQRMPSSKIDEDYSRTGKLAD